MSALLIQMTKRADAGVVLRCVRSDGTATWQRQGGRQGAFFPLHDLTHYAVETELGFREAFYGLIAAGWNIEDTTGKGARGPLPPQALQAEHIVGSLDSERAGGVLSSADEFNAQSSIFYAARGLELPRALTGTELSAIRARRGALFSAWREVGPGGTLELRFPAILPS